MRARLGGAVLVLMSVGFVCCESEIAKQNQATVEQQQQQINRMQQEIAALKAGQSYSTSAPPAGSCDGGVMGRASQQGAEKYAAGDYGKALSYYQDALAACPNSARAEVDIAKTYEALKDREQALAHYRNAAANTDPNEQAAQAEARLALDRLGAASSL